jgi:hypothetical protein
MANGLKSPLSTGIVWFGGIVTCVDCGRIQYGTLDPEDSKAIVAPVCICHYRFTPLRNRLPRSASVSST